MSHSSHDSFPRPHSYFEATARQRISQLLDSGSFREFLPPENSQPSPHLATFDIPSAFDDGVIIGEGRVNSLDVHVIAQEGQFMGGSVGEIHGAKIVGLLKRAARDKPAAVLFLADSGGVRLHEANAGLIAISEIMRAVLDARAAGVPVFALIGGSCGAFGGIGIVSRLCSAIIISEEGRLGLSGPEVIETVMGVEEFDSKDRALVWRVTGGKHRYLMGDCHVLVEDSVASFREAAMDLLAGWCEPEQTLELYRAEQQRLAGRLKNFEGMRDGLEVWAAMKVPAPDQVPIISAPEIIALRKTLSL
jgi:malonate decarboxylase beta subunit